MRVVGFITQPAVIRRILDRLRKREKVARPPPRAPQPVAEPRVRSASPACRGEEKSRRCRLETVAQAFTRRWAFTSPPEPCARRPSGRRNPPLTPS